MLVSQFQRIASAPKLEQYPEGVEFVLSRGVTKEQITEFDLRFDPERSMVVFPIREAYGALAGLRGRAITGFGLKHYDYSHHSDHKNVKGVWFNEPALNLSGKVVVVEGQFDCLRVAQVYPKVVANLTAMPTRHKCLKLALTEGVVLIPDNDKAGLQSVAKYQEMLTPLGVHLEVATLPITVKDAGECHPDFLKEFLAPFVES
jgi:DNA primase